MTKVLQAVLLAAVSTAAVPFSVRYAGKLGPRLSLSWARPAGKNTLSGQDQDGKPWRVALPGNYASAAVFESDLDGNRQADLVIINTVAGEPVCGTAASDVTMMLRDAKGHPSPWQSTMRLARTQREDELPFLLTDHNGDGFAEIAVVECAGETPVLEGIYEVRPEGVVPLPRRAYAGYAGDLKKLYRNKNLSIPGEDSPPLTANEGSAAATLDRIATQEWGGNAAPAEVVLSTGEKISGWPRLGPAQAGFQRTYSTGDGVADLLEVAARRTLVKADPGGMLRTHPAGSQQRVQLVASLVPGQPVERSISLVEAPVPASVRDASFFLTAGKACFALYVGSGAVGAMQAQNCSAAASMRARGLSGEPFVARNSVVWQTDAVAREWRVFDAGDLGAGATTTVQLMAAGRGQLAGVARAGEFLLAQWRDAATSWLTLHQESGLALTGQMPVPATDQLLGVDDKGGLLFLRWAGDKPAVWIEVPARVEWRAEKTQVN